MGKQSRENKGKFLGAFFSDEKSVLKTCFGRLWAFEVLED